MDTPVAILVVLAVRGDLVAEVQQHKTVPVHYAEVDIHEGNLVVGGTFALAGPDCSTVGGQAEGWSSGEDSHHSLVGVAHIGTLVGFGS